MPPFEVEGRPRWGAEVDELSTAVPDQTRGVSHQSISIIVNITIIIISSSSSNLYD